MEYGRSPEPVIHDNNGYTLCCRECYDKIVEPAIYENAKKYRFLARMTIELGDSVVIDPYKTDVGYVIYPDYRVQKISSDEEIKDIIERCSVIHPSFPGYKSYRDAFDGWVMLYDRKESRKNWLAGKEENFWAHCIGGKTIYSPAVFCHKTMYNK